MKNYSQGKEQEVILNYFAGQAGTFLSIGENDGETLSNVRALALSGWVGDCVEPMTEAWQKLAKLYEGADTHCINVAVSDYNGYAVFFESGSHLKKGDSGLLSTLNTSDVARWKGTEEFKETQVVVVDFDELLKLCKHKKFDFISVDCEGEDFKIISQIDFDALGVKMLCVETNGIENEKYDSLMLAWGFKLHFHNHENRIYTK